MKAGNRPALKKEQQGEIPAALSFTISAIQVKVYQVPTIRPESDGTIEWDKTTMVLLTVEAGGKTGIGYTYADTSTALFIKDNLVPKLIGLDAFDISAAWSLMVNSVRNSGRPGIASMAISAVDNALWDLKARLLGLPLVKLLGKVHDGIEIYYSGGFTSYPADALKKEFYEWAEKGVKKFKMKIGRNASDDLKRVKAARATIGDSNELFIDANGAYTVSEALKQTQVFSDYNIKWFEEPVSSDNLVGLKQVRDRIPFGMQVAAGEYGYDQYYFRRMLEAQAVDVLQADATRCAGITGFLQAAVISEAFQTKLSSHCAPALHLHPACAVSNYIHAEYFFDHQRIEKLFFAGVQEPVNGILTPDLSAAGNGLEVKWNEIAKYLI